MFLKIFLLTVITFTYNTNAYAYLDPGLGSIILQGLIGAIAATSLTIKIYWKKIKDYFIKRKKEKTLDK